MFVKKILIAAALLVGCCAAQTATSTVPEPDTIGVYFYLDSASRTLKRLPKEDWKRHRGAGLVSYTDSIKVAGPGSSFHIPAGEKPTFVVSVFKSEDAAEIKLFLFTVKGQEREYQLAKAKGRDVTHNEGVAVNITKFGASSLAVIPESPLEPGEYALPWGSSVFTFSVTASGK